MLVKNMKELHEEISRVLEQSQKGLVESMSKHFEYNPVPRKVHNHDRATELAGALSRCLDNFSDNYELMEEWLDELYDVIDDLKTAQECLKV